MAKMGFIGTLKSATQLPGESLQDFQKEYRRLTEEDKAQLYQWMVAAGIDCEPPKSAN